MTPGLQPVEGLSNGDVSNGALKQETIAQARTENENGHAEEENGASSDEDAGDLPGLATTKKKKKKKPKKKKKAAAAVQSDPPRVGLSHFFAPDGYPVGETHDYVDDNAYRTTSEELRAKEREALQDPESLWNYTHIRRAAEVHRQVRTYARQHIKPGMPMTEIANMIEDAVRALAEEAPEDKLKSGMGFPTGLSLNHCAAHYTPNPGDKIILKEEDVLKVDIGVQVNGRIVDSAFTLNFSPEYDELLKAVKAATNEGVKLAGIDARLSDLGTAIEEVMSSYEVTVPGVNNGLPMRVKPIRNLTGHNILPYSIHGGKSVPIVNDSDESAIMEEGETFAIETFGSTGTGWVRNDDNCSHYAKMPNVRKNLKLGLAKQLLNTINKEFGTLPFCRRYLDRVGETTHALALRNLVENGIVQAYPPLVDRIGSQTAQFEHTVILRPTCKEVVSRGDDY